MPGTKILATLGPASATPKMVQGLVRAGASLLHLRYAYNEAGGYQAADFSPDGKWLSWIAPRDGVLAYRPCPQAASWWARGLTADAARVCCEMLEGFDREAFLVLALSTASRVIGAHVG